MKRLLRIGIVSLAAAGVLFAAFHFTRAQGQAPWKTKKFSPAPKVSQSDLSSKPVQHNLVKTFFTQAYYDGGGPSIPAETDFGLDSPNTFYCWLPCTLEVDAKVEVWNGKAADNWLWVGVLVDGEDLGEGVPVAEVPEDGSIVVGPFDWNVSLQPGTHTVQSFVGADAEVSLVGWHNNYRIYFP
jgi:hypothetical protein